MKKPSPTARGLLALVLALCLAVPLAAYAAPQGGAPNVKEGTPAASGTATGKDAKSKAAATTDTPEDAKTASPSEELLAWAETMECAACHTVEAESAENPGAPMSTHAAFQMDCVTCHADDVLIEVHEAVDAGARMPKRLKKSAVPAGACQTCHNAEDLAQKTADSEALVDMNGTVVNPHDLPDVEDHADITCGSCHQMHSDKGIDRTARATCNSCHHAGVFECGTCHAE